MPAKFVIHLKPSNSLAAINNQVSQNEQTMGALSAIGNDGATTMLTFDATGLPAKTAVIAPQVAGVPTVPAGATLVTTGSIFVAGALVLAAATR